jgi:hypothetical protein
MTGTWSHLDDLIAVKNDQLIKMICYFTIEEYIQRRNRLTCLFPNNFTRKLSLLITCTCIIPVQKEDLNHMGLQWSWSYGSWIYNYLWNQWSITTIVVNSNPAHGEVDSIQLVINHRWPTKCIHRLLLLK